MLERFPFQGAAKFCLGRLGVPVREDVRRPLRTLLPEEKAELDQWLGSS
jgi:dihydrodipicolinate synthase/N-acetylneuraminate lyase